MGSVRITLASTYRKGFHKLTLQISQDMSSSKLLAFYDNMVFLVQSVGILISEAYKRYLLRVRIPCFF